MSECEPLTFSDVQAKERDVIRARRQRFGSDSAGKNDLAGLAISGGGIRVATFALGAIQAMASFRTEREDETEAISEGFRTLYEAGHGDTGAEGNAESSPTIDGSQHTGVLGAFDYVSTVSGGGFIGGWLTSWIQRRSRAVAPATTPDTAATTQTDADEPPGSPSAAPGLSAVCAALRFSVSQDKGEKAVTEASEVTYLRRFSNYLSPQVGLFSADTWTMVAIYLRNFLLNVVTLSAVTLALIVFIFFTVRGFGSLFSDQTHPRLLNISVWLTALLAMGAWTFCRCLWNVGRAPRVVCRSRGYGAKTIDGAAAMKWTVLLFCLTALTAIPALAAREQLVEWLRWFTRSSEVAQWQIALAMAVLVAALHGAPGLVCLLPMYQEKKVTASKPAGPREKPKTAQRPIVPLWPFRLWSTACAVGIGALSGFVGGLLLYAILVFPKWHAIHHPDLFVVFGPPLVLFIVTVGVAVEVGFLSRSSTAHEREWWARLAAWLLICATVWLVVTAIVIYSGPAFAWMGGAVQLALGTGAIGVSALAAKLGSSARTRHSGSGPIATFIVRIGPALFVLALAIGTSAFVRNVILTPAPEVAWSTRVRAALDNAQAASRAESRRDRLADVLPWTVTEEQTAAVDAPPARITLKRDFTLYPTLFSDGLRETRAAIQNTSYLRLLLSIVIPLVLAGLLSARFDINMNSLNRAWSNRLIRCYLGASNRDRKAHSSTGFDESDDMPLVALRNAAFEPSAAKQDQRGFRSFLRRMTHGLIYGVPLSKHASRSADVQDYDGPLHLISGALNVYGSDDLSRQERHAESFVMSPLFCGYTLADSLRDESDNAQVGCYTPTDDYAENLTLGAAVGISGAAATPNMGYHTMPSLAALMTVFNVRLGWWLPNPAEKNCGTLRSSGPMLGLRYLSAELFSRTTARTRYVYVSDGGHFENLATYELIRRRTKFIVVVDGEADPTYEFHGLGSLVRKCRVDFGVDIQISAHAIQPVGVAKIRNPVPTEAPPTLEDRLAKVNYALGLIHYPNSSQHAASTGLLIYVKSSLVAEDALHVADLRQYAEAHSTFPHESTADQFFSESQFESYRLLGQLIMSRVLSDTLSAADSTEYRSASETPPDGTGTEPATVNTKVRALAEECLRETELTESAALKSRNTKASTNKGPRRITQQQTELTRLLTQFRTHCQNFGKPKTHEAGQP